MQSTHSPVWRPCAAQPAERCRDSRRLSDQAGSENDPVGWPCEQEFLARFGDAIDDRVAEILDEVLDELLNERESARQPMRLTAVLSVASLLLAAAAAGVLLRRDVLAWAIWSATATLCFAALWIAVSRRPR